MCIFLHPCPSTCLLTFCAPRHSAFTLFAVWLEAVAPFAICIRTYGYKLVSTLFFANVGGQGEVLCQTCRHHHNAGVVEWKRRNSFPKSGNNPIYHGKLWLKCTNFPLERCMRTKESRCLKHSWVWKVRRDREPWRCGAGLAPVCMSNKNVELLGLLGILARILKQDKDCIAIQGFSTQQIQRLTCSVSVLLDTRDFSPLLWAMV